jgi:high-affinity nickel-transport protein
MAVVTVAALHLIGWGTLLALVIPLGVSFGSDTAAPLATAGVGLTAYALGMRHAFDADHIAAIDNTTRRFIDQSKQTATVGFWFSLGHCTVVFVLCALLTLGIGAIGVALRADDSVLLTWTGVWGPMVSSVFLLVVAAVNLRSLAARGRSPGRDRALVHGGFVWRLLARFDRLIDRPSRMYAVGLLFGLGFDTATEIGLLALAGSATLTHVPWWAALSLPVLFAAGMSLLDTAQGAVIRRAYAWSPARSNPARTYQVGMVMLSVATAVVVGLVQLAGVSAALFGWQGAVAWIGALGIDDLGFWFTGGLLAIWIVAFAVARARGDSSRVSTGP